MKENIKLFFSRKLFQFVYNLISVCRKQNSNFNYIHIISSITITTA